MTQSQSLGIVLGQNSKEEHFVKLLIPGQPASEQVRCTLPSKLLQTSGVRASVRFTFTSQLSPKPISHPPPIACQPSSDELIAKISSIQGKLKEGDVLLQVNGNSLTKLSIPSASKLLKGTAGSIVELLVRQNGEVQYLIAFHFA